MYKDGLMLKDVIAFGPLSVLPEFQKKGIGSLLVNSTIQKAKDLGYKLILITGNQNYYKRFGFEIGFNHNIHLNGNEPDITDYFLVKELVKGTIKNYAGTYDFDEVFYYNDEKILEEYDKQFPKKVKREKRETDIG